MTHGCRRYAAVALWSLALHVTASSASAHSPPAIREVRWDAATGTTTLLTNRGFILGSAAEGYQLICNQAYKAPSSERVDFVETASGALLVATASGMLRGDEGGCAFNPVPPFEDVPVYAMAELADDTLLAVTGELPGRLFVSADQGDTWQARSTLAPDLFIERVVAAPSDPQRLYGDGIATGTGNSSQVLVWSLDEGLTWQRAAVPLLDNEGDASLLDVSPTDPLAVLVRTHDYAATGMDRLLLTVDGGLTYTTLLTTKDITSARFTNDGVGLAATGFDGLWSTQELAQPLARHPEAENMSCAFFREGALHVCGNYRGFVDGADGLARADGQGFTALVEFGQVDRPVACAADAPTSMACDALWQDWAREQLGAPLVPDEPTTAVPGGNEPPTAGSNGPTPTPTVPPTPAPAGAQQPAVQPATAGTSDAQAAPGGGCGCRLASGASGATGSGLASAAGLLGALGLRRRRGRR